jgi:hypothetical protein
MTYNDELDQVLDDALEEFREAEPLAGLEERVLQRLRLQPERQRGFWWRWSAIAVAAAALAIAAWIGLERRTRQEIAPPVATVKQAPVEPAQKSASALAASQPIAKRNPVAKPVSRVAAVVPMPAQLAADRAVPGAETFPSPVPLKAEEQMLLALATTHPDLLTKEPDGDKEIVIAPINIKPLVDETGGPQGEN